MIGRFFRPKVLLSGVVATAIIVASLLFGIQYDVPYAMRIQAALTSSSQYAANTVIPLIPSVIFGLGIAFACILLLVAAYQFIIPGKQKSRNPTTKADGPKKM